MSENCNHDCGSCSSKCDQATDFTVKPLESTKVKKVIGVVSGKGGVGKSTVTSMLAVAMRNKGYKTAILDADITGPSIPKAFGISGDAMANDEGIIPALSKTGIEIMSVNLILENETDPVVWRGPVIAGTVKQFWSDVIWGDVDYMFVDMPPGTGDVPLTVFQSLPVDGIVIVTSPQELVGMIVSKAVKMAEMMDVPVLGLVENFSYFKCPDCGNIHQIFGPGKVEEIAEENRIGAVAKLPIDPLFAAKCDKGLVEMADTEGLNEITEMLEELDADGEKSPF